MIAWYKKIYHLHSHIPPLLPRKRAYIAAVPSGVALLSLVVTAPGFLKDSTSFSKILQYIPRFCNILQDFPRFYKIFQDSIKFSKNFLPKFDYYFLQIKMKKQKLEKKSSFLSPLIEKQYSDTAILQVKLR